MLTAVDRDPSLTTFKGVEPSDEVSLNIVIKQLKLRYSFVPADIRFVVYMSH